MTDLFVCGTVSHKIHTTSKQTPSNSICLVFTSKTLKETRNHPAFSIRPKDLNTYSMIGMLLIEHQVIWLAPTDFCCTAQMRMLAWAIPFLLKRRGGYPDYLYPDFRVPCIFTVTCMVIFSHTKSYSVIKKEEFFFSVSVSDVRIIMSRLKHSSQLKDTLIKVL